MPDESTGYVFQTPEGGWRITGSRVSLESIVHAYWNGASPESIVQSFPTLSFEQVHGTIAFYLHHRAEIDKYMQSLETKWDQLHVETESKNAALLQRIRSARSVTQS